MILQLYAGIINNIGVSHMTTERLIDKDTEKKLITAQKTEITEHYIYDRLSHSVKGDGNREILQRISKDELKHHNLCNYYTCIEVKPNRFKIWLYYVISRVFGITFGLKLMERGEDKAHAAYQQLAKTIPEVENVVLDEERHGNELIDLIDDERLEYSSDIVRGLNVALVEITGALAGFTFALQDKNLVLTAGLIIGITVSLSTTSTEYIATKSSTSVKSPLKSAFYAWLANIVAIAFLLLPYLIFSNIYLALGLMILDAVIVIFILTFYLSIARETSIIKMFLEMTVVSLGIAALAFGIGFLAREFLHIHV
jgi:VIT1/CCC1 family predicted Fe2+/Mn2+ transporter